MKIQESQHVLSAQRSELDKAGLFAGKTMNALSASSNKVPLSAQLQRYFPLNQVQELALQRLQQGEHTHLSDRRIRVL
ncbi:T3SS regulon translocated regulator ExsE family protein [Aeromonas aquatilis]